MLRASMHVVMAVSIQWHIAEDIPSDTVIYHRSVDNYASG